MLKRLDPKVREIVKELHKQGCSAPHIMKRLTEAGLTKANGSEFDLNYVKMLMYEKPMKQGGGLVSEVFERAAARKAQKKIPTKVKELIARGEVKILRSKSPVIRLLQGRIQKLENEKSFLQEKARFFETAYKFMETHCKCKVRVVQK